MTQANDGKELKACPFLTNGLVDIVLDEIKWTIEDCPNRRSHDAGGEEMDEWQKFALSFLPKLSKGYHWELENGEPVAVRAYEQTVDTPGAEERVLYSMPEERVDDLQCSLARAEEEIADLKAPTPTAQADEGERITGKQIKEALLKSLEEEGIEGWLETLEEVERKYPRLADDNANPFENRADKIASLQAELAMVDESLARTPALADKNSRYEKIRFAIMTVSQKEKEIASLQAALAEKEKQAHSYEEEMAAVLPEDLSLKEYVDLLKKRIQKLEKRFSCEHGVLFSNNDEYDCPKCEREDKALALAIKKAGVVGQNDRLKAKLQKAEKVVETVKVRLHSSEHDNPEASLHQQLIDRVRWAEPAITEHDKETK